MSFPLRRVLVTNDDGIDAPGLAVLEDVAAQIAEDVWVVAPDGDRSGASCSVSLHTPLRIHAKGPRRFAVSGTPADCVAAGLAHLVGKPVDMVLSGINAGVNIGSEVLLSGTVGAALAGAAHDVPSVALSQAYRNLDAVPWETSRVWAPRALYALMAHGWAPSMFYSVNIPDAPPDQVEGLAAARVEPTRFDLSLDTRQDTRLRDYFWVRLRHHAREPAAVTDIAALRARRVAITPITLSQTLETGFAELAAALEDATVD